MQKRFYDPKAEEARMLKKKAARRAAAEQERLGLSDRQTKSRSKKLGRRLFDRRLGKP